MRWLDNGIVDLQLFPHEDKIKKPQTRRYAGVSPDPPTYPGPQAMSTSVGG